METTRLASRFARASNFLQSTSPIGETQLMEVAPSIFAPAAHESRSQRYTYIPTINVLRGLQREGFYAFFAGQSRSRIPGKGDYTKHMLRLRHASTSATGEANEIILINSHDGTSGYQMIAGVLRFVCMNGMVCGDIVEDFRVPHKGNIVAQVIDAAFRITDGFGRVNESVEQMRSVQLNTGEQLVFAQAAAQIRFGAATLSSGEVVANAPVQSHQLLGVRRDEDNTNDLWTTFNRVQENVIRGGLDGRSALGRQVQTREVRSIDRNVSINRALWTLAEGMKTLKSGGTLNVESPELTTA